MKKVIVFLTIVCFFLSGCATTYKLDHDIIKGFQEPKVSADKTGLFVIRGSNFTGGGCGLLLTVNDSVVANLSNGSHVYLELDAGVNTINFVEEKLDNLRFCYLPVDNKPGATLYARVNYTNPDPSGFVEFIEKDLGKLMVMKTKAVQTLQKKRNNDGEKSLCFFRIVPGRGMPARGTVILTNVKDGKPIKIAFTTNSWVSVHLPPGEYYISEYESRSNKMSYSYAQGGLYMTGQFKSYEIRAEFVVAKAGMGIYLGDITYSDRGIVIHNDSLAAHAFLVQRSKELPYAESLISINR